MTRHMWLTSAVPDDFCNPQDLPHIRQLHNKVRNGEFDIVPYSSAIKSYVAIVLWEEPEKKWKFYEELKLLLDEKRVAANVILRYIEEEFASQYDRCMFYAQRECKDMFDEEWINMLQRTLSALEKNPEKYREYNIRYKIWEWTYGNYPNLTSQTDRTYNPRDFIIALRTIKESNPGKKISIESITLK